MKWLIAIGIFMLVIVDTILAIIMHKQDKSKPIFCDYYDLLNKR